MRQVYGDKNEAVLRDVRDTLAKVEAVAQAKAGAR